MNPKDQLKEIEERDRDMMLCEMTGFKIGKWDDITALAISSNLTKKQWEYIKKNEDSGHLDDEDIEELDKYYEDKLLELEE
jgi:hypothetical protein